jgi:outer membrane protein assembly factor BamA
MVLKARIPFRAVHLFFLVTLFFSAFFTFLEASGDSSNISFVPPKKVATISVHGNHITKTNVILKFMDIDSGALFDSSAIKKANDRLESTGLFSKVDIIHLEKEDGIHLYVMLAELPYISIADIGGELFAHKYGNDQIWWKFRLAIELANFRGRLETIRPSISFWDSRSLGLAWTKPIIPTPYFLGIGAQINQYPDGDTVLDYTAAKAHLTVGRHIGKRSTCAVDVTPIYRYRDYKDSNEIVIDGNYTQHRNDKDYGEVFGSFRFWTDHRNDRFDPHKGFYVFSELKTNRIYTKQIKFDQLYLDTRFFHKLFAHKMGYRLQTILRDTSAGDIHKLTFGGDGSVRGFGRNAFGNRNITVNNAFLFSTEYHFPIWRSPFFEIPVLPFVHELLTSQFSSLYLTLKGALVYDAGYFLNNLDRSTEMEKAMGIGGGFRVLVPPLRQSASLDIVYGHSPQILDEIGFFQHMVIHTYVGMSF